MASFIGVAIGEARSHKTDGERMISDQEPKEEKGTSEEKVRAREIGENLGLCMLEGKRREEGRGEKFCSRFRNKEKINEFIFLM